MLFRNIALIFSLEKPCYLENRVVREPCKWRSACNKDPSSLLYFWRTLHRLSVLYGGETQQD